MTDWRAFNDKDIHTIKACRVCRSSRLTPLFSLGNLYISTFVDKDESGLQCPLELLFCENCSLVQLRHSAPQELLYSGYYWYKSGVTDTMVQALRDVTANIEQSFEIKTGDIVLDIGSNDGSLLRSYTIPGLRTIGVEPAKNLADEGRLGLTGFIADYWSYETYWKAFPEKAKIVTAIGMFYDMEDPNLFIADIARVLRADGVFITQLMCLKNMIDGNDIGNICHEHLEYYSFASLEYLFQKNGLEIFDVEINDVNGGSYRLFAKLKGARVSAPAGAAERIARVRQGETPFQARQCYLDFFTRIERNKQLCLDFIRRAVRKGKRVWIYGASTKGNTILQYYGLDHELIQGASERSPWKFGKYTIGTRIPIFSEEEARQADPDYFLILPYAFYREMVEREQEWLNRGGQFLVPLPEFRVLS